MSDLDDSAKTILGQKTPDRAELAAFPPPAPPPNPRRWRKPVAVLAGLIALAGIGAAGYMLGRTSDSEVTTTPNLSSEELAPASPGTAEDQAEGDTVADQAAGDTAQEGEPEADGSASTDTGTDAETDGADSDADGTGSAGSEPADTDGADTDDVDTATASDTDTDTVDNSDGSIRWAVFSNGEVFLRGRVPSEEISAEIETKAAAVVGPENVFNEYEIDPSVPAELSSPLYVEDVVLFEFNSVEIRRPFLPILDLGTTLLTLNPNVEIVVVGRTDAEGSEAANLDVSEKRAQGVVDYWVRNGIDPRRLSIDGRGESEASEQDDAETAALNRRAEFIISGLLDD